MLKLLLKTKIGIRSETKLDSSKGDCEFSYSGFSVIMNISNFYKKGKLEILKDEDQTAYLNKYIYAKGIEGDIYRIYSEVKNRLDNDNFDPTLDNSIKGKRLFLKEKLFEIMDMFNPEEIGQFLKDNGVKSLKGLKGEFDKSKELDQIQSEDQTYLYNELYGLLGIAIMSKALAPILGEAYSSAKDLFMSTNETLSYLNLISDHKVFDSEPMKRLVRYIHKHINTKVAANSQQKMIVSLNTNISEDILWELALANSMFKKFVTMPVSKEQPQTGNVASAVYTIIKSITKDKMSVSGSYSFKDTVKPMYGEDTANVAESYLQTTDISIGDIVEFNFFTKDVAHIYKMLGGNDPKLLSDFVSYASPLYSNKSIISKGSIVYASYMVHNRVMDARAIKLLEYTNLVNVMVATATYLYEIGENELSSLIMMMRTKDDGGLTMSQSSSTPTEELRTNIDKHYVKSMLKPRRSKKSIGADVTFISVINKYINDSDALFCDNTYKYLIPRDMRPDTMKSKIFTLPHNIKTLMINLLNISREL